MLWLVAESVHSGARLVARRGGVAAGCIRLPLPEARIVAKSGRIHRLRGGGRARVPSAICPSVRMDMVGSEDEAMGCRAWPLNFPLYLLPGPLGAAVLMRDQACFARVWLLVALSMFAGSVARAQTPPDGPAPAAAVESPRP